jgi:hypothetical protein
LRTAEFLEKPSRPAKLHPTWDPQTKRLEISGNGVSGGATTYTYRIEFNAHEVAEMLEAIADGDPERPDLAERAVRAMGAAMAAFLRELVREDARR